MRVMVLIKANEQSEAGVMPSEQLLTEMGNFNEELVNAGIMVAGEGLHPSSKGVRVKLSDAEPQVINGPFPNTSELVAGFWIWEVESMDQAVDLVKRIPNPPGELVAESDSTIEIRPIFEEEDFGEAFTPEARAQEDRMREQLAKRADT